MSTAFELNQGTWQERLNYVVAMMREMSIERDPQKMVQAYAARVRRLMPADRWLAFSRRGLDAPRYKITRSSIWTGAINPWKESHKLPVYDRGLLGELLYAGEPRIITDLDVGEDDPAYDHLEGLRSLMVIPHFEGGETLNMVVTGSRQPDAFDAERLPELFWLSNLFGRVTHNLVLSEQVQAAYAAVDQELQVVADIQRSLLPRQLPQVPTLDLAAYYQTSRRAGGDYYDFFPLPGGKLGIFLADASGHGTPATVMMAITHSVAHSYPGPQCPPGKMLEYLNKQLGSRYTGENDSFVTAFYGVYDPATHDLIFSSAGHNPPRRRHATGRIEDLGEVAGLPLGIYVDEQYADTRCRLADGDTLLFYTDGFSEAAATDGKQFGVDGLDAVLRASRGSAQDLLASLLGAVDDFTGGASPDDDRTVLVARVTS